MLCELGSRSSRDFFGTSELLLLLEILLRRRYYITGKNGNEDQQDRAGNDKNPKYIDDNVADLTGW